MHQVLTTLFDLLFPKSDDARLVEDLVPEVMRTYINVHTYSDITCITRFREPAIRALVHEAKFHHNLHAITLLGVLFKVYLDGLPKREASIIVPIPLAPARLRMRGYNQVHEIVKSVELRSVAIDTTSLVRTRNTKPQSELPKEARERNIAGAFTVKYPERITKCHVILVDDVATTGATMRAAKAALLLHHPASIKCIALAH